VRAAEAVDAVSVRIDWMGIAKQLQEQYAQARRISRTQLLWHRLTSSVARMFFEWQQIEHSSIAAEPSETTRK
jgi:hypothetical protein